MKRPLGIAGQIAAAFLNSKLTPLFIIASLAIGAFAITVIPREEEPQIVVPMLDVTTTLPGASPSEVEQRVTLPLERLLHGIPGVEFVYSTSSPGTSLVIARFEVGTKQEDALVKTYSKILSNPTVLPAGASQPIIKERSIDDVPILSLTLWGKNYDAYHLRLIAEELNDSVKQVKDVSETSILGGQPRTLRVELSQSQLQAYGLTPDAIAARLEAANAHLDAGQFANGNRAIDVEAGQFLTSKEQLEEVVLAVDHGRAVTVRDVAANVVDGPADPDTYVLFGVGAASTPGAAPPGAEFPALTLTIAKRKGTNATDVAKAVLERIGEMRKSTLPADLNITTTRNYGDTAKAKSDELLEHLVLATLSVTLLIAIFLGWRESGVVLLAIPVTLALTLAAFYLFGYTINRVTLFALIFSIGILVDDAIVVVENIVRHFRLPESQGRPQGEVALEAVAEVGNPTILATIAVIAAILPMAFVRGLMGPYMRPIPIGASSAMFFSLLVAFIVSPWAALRLVAHDSAYAKQHASAENWSTRFYRRIMSPLIEKASARWLFLCGVIVLLLLSVALVPFKLVRVKMLPFDNKSEFQVIVDMPDGTPLEQTAHVTQVLGQYLAHQPEILNYQAYAGLSGPYNFNGLVRHYYLRHGANQADIQVNLLPIADRNTQSHEIAKRLRPELVRLGLPFGARVKVSEVPPGPPVVQTLVAEVYGPSETGQIEVAEKIKHIFETTAGVVDVDWYVNDAQPQETFVVDQTQAALHGISVAAVAHALAATVSGVDAGLLHDESSREALPVHLQFARSDRSGIDQLDSTKLRGTDGSLVSLRELTRVEPGTLDNSIYHKNLQRVVYVTGDVSGVEESPVYAIFKMNEMLDHLKLPAGYTLTRYNMVQPESTDHYSMKWDGEWQITLEVFRDLGLAFAVVLLLIYVLVVGWFRSFVVPLVIMAPIPLTLVGILPAHALLGSFFTATSMIGFIAGAGIIVRNSIILVDFIELRRAQGMPLAEAVIDAGAVRFRPMLLTAAAVVVGASVILSDPIFQGLALSLIAGELASTILSRLAVPVLYFMANHRSALTPGLKRTFL